MLICHVSDWHGQTRKLPEADIYAVTGDMLPNFPLVRFHTADGAEGFWDPEHKFPWPKNVRYAGRVLDPDREARLQLEWMLENPFGEATGIRDDAPVVCVRGNHDFTDLTPWFLLGNRKVYEVSEDPAVAFELGGLLFGGMRGVMPISGEWSDEHSPDELDNRARQIGTDIHVLLTHTPPEGTLDGAPYHSWGAPAINSYLQRRYYSGDAPLRAHLFGHVHESFGKRTDMGGTLFVNSATGFQLVELT